MIEKYKACNIFDQPMKLNGTGEPFQSPNPETRFVSTEIVAALTPTPPPQHRTLHQTHNRLERRETMHEMEAINPVDRHFEHSTAPASRGRSMR